MRLHLLEDGEPCLFEQDPGVGEWIGIGSRLEPFFPEKLLKEFKVARIDPGASIPLKEEILVPPEPGAPTGFRLARRLTEVLIAPVLAVQYDLPQALYGVLALSLLLGTPVLSMIGAIGAALTLGVRGGGVLLALLVLPLYVPVLIMGAGAVEMAAAGLESGGQLLILGALLVFTAAFAPWAIAAALRISLE